MMKNKGVAIIVALVLCIITFNSTFAVEIFDNKTSSEVYKVSEDDSSFDVPFSRIVENRIEVDKSISQMGLFMTTSSIEVSEPLKGIQVFYSNDTIRINSDTEYPIIFSTGNVVINGTIEKTTFIYCNGTITIGEKANIKENLICYAPKIEINGVVDGNILGNVNILNINNVVKGKIKMNVVEVNSSENAKVEKGLEINTSNKELTISENVGTSTIDIISNEKDTSVKSYLLEVLTATLGNIVIFLLILIFVKKDRLEKIADKLQNGRMVLKNGIYSYLFLLAMLCFGVVLLVLLTKLGVVFLVFGAAVLTIITILKNVIFGTFITELVSKKYNDAQVKPNNILTAIMTLLILELLETIPYVGEVIKFITFIISLGIIVSLTFKTRFNVTKEDKTEVIEAK
ncbi:MAG: hypothetical protein ACI4ON_03895 [Clostridia bacterium]